MCYRSASYEKWQAQHAHRRRRRAEKYRRWTQGTTAPLPPVNVRELDDRYELYLFAPERKNEDFQLALRDRILTKAEYDAAMVVVIERKGAWSVVDLEVAGIWLAIEQRAQVASLLSRPGADIDDVIAQFG